MLADAKTAEGGTAEPLITVKPTPSSTIGNRLPLIEVDLSKLTGIDPGSMILRVTGFGRVPHTYNPANGLVTYQIPQRLRLDSCGVQLTFRHAGSEENEVIGWTFQINRLADYLSSEATAPGKNDSKNKRGKQLVLPSTLASYPGEVRNPERSNRTNREVQDITDKLAINRPSILGSRFSQDSLRPVSPSLKIPEKEHNQLYAKASQDDMYNPIEPITRAISDKTKMPVDFRKTKPNSAKKGFHLKIGKFEVSRNRH